MSFHALILLAIAYVAGDQPNPPPRAIGARGRNAKRPTLKGLRP